MHREYHKWFSNHLQRYMELLIFGYSGRIVLFFPTRMARFYDYENWQIIDTLKDQVINGELQIVCVDSIDAESFYNHHISPAARINRHIQYEQYILNEVVPFMRSKNGRQHFGVAGCSMGAYHALNLAMKCPTLFNKVVGMSGRYDLTSQLYDFKDLFDGYHDENIYFNMPLQFVANLENPHTLNAIGNMNIILAVGETDPFLQNNIQFSQLLCRKGVHNNLYIWDDYAHRPRYWRQMVQMYL